MRKIKVGDSVRVESNFLRYNGIVEKVGSKYIYISTVGTKSVLEKYDLVSGLFVQKDGTLTNTKRIY